MTTFPPTGIAACPRNEQPQMLLCEKSNSFQRHQDLPWTEHRLLYQKMSHQMSFTRWTSEMLYPGVSGGTRFASTNSFSLVKSKQFSGKNSMTTLILHACRSTKTNIFFLEVISEPKNPVPEGLFVKPTPASYPKPLSCLHQSWHSVFHTKTPLGEHTPPFSLDGVWVIFMGHPTKSTV